jgi:hypothetical protein
MRRLARWLGGMLVLGGVLCGTASYAKNGDWSGAGWYAVLKNNETFDKDVYSGPFASQNACVSAYNANPSPYKNVTLTCTYYGTSDAYYRDLFMGD